MGVVSDDAKSPPLTLVGFDVIFVPHLLQKTALSGNLLPQFGQNIHL